jgi:acetyl esterase/lipase
MPRHPVAPRRQALTVASLLAALVLVASGCQLRLATPEGPAPLRYRDEVFSQVTTTSGITYGSAVDQEGVRQQLALDLYQPTGDTRTRRPAVIWIHGGGFSGGNRTSRDIVDQTTTFAKKGFVTASITYRLSDTGCSAGGVSSSCLTAITDAKHDAQAAVRFLRAHAADYGIAPDLIAVAGTSAGAITALNVAYGSDDVGSSGTPGPSSKVRAAVSLSGARLLTAPSADDAPALLFHGDADTVVPYQWALDTIREARAAGQVAELTTWEGAGHVPYGAHRDQIIEETTNFLWWNLDLARAPTR